MPTMYLSLSSITCLTPPASMMTGEEYDGPSPVHCHFTSPLFMSHATSAPLASLPTCAKAIPSAISGEVPVQNFGSVFENSLLNCFRQTTFPDSASRHEIVPA